MVDRLINRKTYPCYLGGKQHDINMNLVQYAIDNGYIGIQQIIYDPSCGPLGTEIAKTKIENLDSIWIGSDIAIPPLRGRQNVFCANAICIPLAANAIDTCVSVFAMCNIPNINTAIKEFSRIVKHDGHLIIADPGISKKASDITFYCYLASQSYNPLDYLPESTVSDIDNFLHNQGISEDEYLETALQQHGLDLDEYAQLLNTAYTKKRKQRREIQRRMADRQTDFIKNLAEQNGLALIDEGYILSQTNDNIWETSRVKQTKIKPSMAQSIQTIVLVFKK